jgi:tetratricopeptide (TPR) repeat protein
VGHAFVGRARERRQLLEVLAEAAAGRGAAAMLVGDAGLGKSRLADEIAREAAERGFGVAWGRGWEVGGAPAYWPWRQALRSLGLAMPALPASSDADEARFATFEAVARALHDASIAAPLLLVLDDLHVVDEESLGLLLFLVRDVRAARMLVLGAFRPHHAVEGSAAARLLASIAREGTHLPLRPLDRGEVEALARDAAGGALDIEALEVVHRRAEGNPLFVVEVARLLDGAADPGRADVGVPADVRALLAERMRRLDPGTRDILERAAVLGREVDLRVLGEPTEVLALLAPAIQAGLLERLGDALRFTHVLLRDALDAGLNVPRRCELHAAAATRLQQLAGGAREPALDAIAHHAIEAGSAMAPRAAAAAVVAAARHGLSALAFDRVAALTGRALDRFALSGEDEIGLHVELLVQHGVALVRAGQPEPARVALLRALDLAREGGDGVALARVALALGADFRIGWIDATLVAALEEALARLGEEPSMLRAQVQARLAAARQPAPHVEQPVALAREAIAMARATAGPGGMLPVLASAMAALTPFVPPQERLDLDEELVAAAAVTGDPIPALRAHVRMCFTAMEGGDPARADAHIARYEALATPLRAAKYHWPALGMRRMRALFEARWDDFDALGARMLELARGDAAMHVAVSGQSLVRLIAEDRHEEVLALEPAVLEATAGAAMGRLLLPGYFARTRARRGELERVRSDLERVMRAAGPMRPSLLTFWAEAVAAAGDREMVAECHAMLLPRRDRLYNLDLVPYVVEHPTTRALGLLATAMGRHDEALAHLEHAVADLERMNGQAYLPRARSELEAARRRVGPGARREAEPVSRPASPLASDRGALSAVSFTLAAEGDVFAVTYGGATTRLKSTVGLAMLATLVGRPEEAVHVLELSSPGGAVDGGDAGPALDARAAASYRARAQHLREALEEAEARGDLGRLERLREELDALAEELASGLGLGGRDRRAGNATERARVNVTRHVRGAIKRIAADLPELGRFLDLAVKTGNLCSFSPRRTMFIPE